MMSTDASMDDAQAVAQTLSGQRAAFEVLVERYLPAVRAYLVSRTGSVEEAAEIAQETFVKAFRGLSSLRAPDTFGPWVIAIAQDTLLRLGESRERQALEKQPSPGNAPRKNTGQEEVRAPLLPQVVVLPEPLRDVLILHYFAGASTRDIGALLGVSKWTAEKRLLSARRALGDRIVDQFGSAIRPYRVRKEDVLAVMGVIHSVLVPRAAYALPPVQVAAPTSWSSLPWLAAGLALLLLLIIMIWNAASPNDAGDDAIQGRDTAAQTEAPTPAEAKPAPGDRTKPPIAASAEKRSGKTDSNAPAPSTEARRTTPSELRAETARSAPWFAILPRQNTIRERDELFRDEPSGKFGILVSSWARRNPAADTQLEIRNDDGAVLRGRIPYRPRLNGGLGSELAAVDPIYPTEAQIRSLGVLEPGKYLIALMQGKKRVSNVAALVVDPAFTPKPGQELTVSALEPPANSIPALGIQALAPYAQDPTFTNAAVESAEILIDGVARRTGSSGGGAPAGPLPAVQVHAFVKDLSILDPPLALEAQAAVRIRVGRYLSNTITVPAAYPDARIWDAGTARLDQTPAPQMQLTGAIVGLDGAPGAGYILKLVAKSDESAKSYSERADTSGKYSFRSVPAGRYTLHCASGGAELQISDIDLAETETVRLDISLERRYHFSGHVQDSQGNPVENAKVTANWQDNEVGLYRESTHSDADGRYEVAAPFTMVVGVHAVKAGYTDPPSPDGAEKHQGALSGRGDVDIVLVTGEDRAQFGKEQPETDAPASPAPPFGDQNEADQ